jgi:putative copper export protein
MASAWRFLHLVAAAYWLGGLILLAIVALVARKTLAPEDFGFLMRRSGRVFAIGAATAGLVLAVSGVALARRRFVSVEALATTPAGRTLALKTVLAIFAVLLTLLHSWTGSGRTHRAVIASRALSTAILLLTLGIFYLASRLAG